MVYSNKFVVCILINGEVQKEFADNTVALPANSEYVLRFRNKNPRRAVVKFTIDGENVSGNGYIVPANDYVDIKRHNDIDRAFKFVSTESADAVDFGKNGPNHDRSKGVIKATFFLEKENPQVIHHYHNHYHPRPLLRKGKDRMPLPWVNPITPTPYWGGEINMGDSGATSYNAGESLGFASPQLSCNAGEQQYRAFSPSTTQIGASNLQDGCTVEGSISGQKFESAHIDTEEEGTTLTVVLKLDVSMKPHPNKPSPKKNSRVSDPALTDLEQENEALKKQIAELENAALKKKLEELTK